MARILVVDDVRFIMEMIASLFRSRGHEVFTATDGLEALDVARQERPDLVLLDIAMPGMDGIEVTRQLRREDGTRSIPILMITAQSDRQSVARAIEAGANDCIAKPFQNETLLEKSAELLGSFRMSFSVEPERGVSVMTVLKSELTAETETDLGAALEAAGREGAVVVLDMSRVVKVDQSCSDALVRRADALRQAGCPLLIVQPGRGIGTRTLAVRLEPHAELYPTREKAMKAAGAGPVPTADPPPAPSLAQAPASPRAPSCLVESIGKVTMVRVRGGTLEEAVAKAREQVLPLARQDVVLTIRQVTDLVPSGLDALSSLAQEIRGGGRSFRIASADPELIEALRGAGIADLVVERSPSG